VDAQIGKAGLFTLKKWAIQVEWPMVKLASKTNDYGFA
jgi:hypothetical protein